MAARTIKIDNVISAISLFVGGSTKFGSTPGGGWPAGIVHKSAMAVVDDRCVGYLRRGMTIKGATPVESGVRWQITECTKSRIQAGVNCV